VEIDAFVVMPNHFHGIIILTDIQSEPVGAGPRACPTPKTAQPPQKTGQPQGPAPTVTLGDVVHRFKSLTTARYRQNVKKLGWPPFSGCLWQRNYYEHIIRAENDFNTVCEYILLNPAKWAEDDENPDFVGAGPCARLSAKTIHPLPKTGQPRGVAPTENK
jgi:REP element-mobilizing transposase RayT